MITPIFNLTVNPYLVKAAQRENIAFHNKEVYKLAIDAITFKPQGVQYNCNRCMTNASLFKDLLNKAVCRRCTKRYRYIPENVSNILIPNDEGLLDINNDIPDYCAVCGEIEDAYSMVFLPYQEFLFDHKPSFIKDLIVDTMEKDTEKLKTYIWYTLLEYRLICQFCFQRITGYYGSQVPKEVNFDIDGRISLLTERSDGHEEELELGFLIKRCICYTNEVPPVPSETLTIQQDLYEQLRDFIKQTHCLCGNIKKRNTSVCIKCKCQIAMYCLPAIIMCTAIS